jgi:hypothetical protein
LEDRFESGGMTAVLNAHFESGKRTAEHAHCESGMMTAEEENTNVKTQQTQHASKVIKCPPVCNAKQLS